MAKTIFDEMYNIEEAIETAACFASGHTRYNEHIPTSRGQTANALMAYALWACGLIEKEDSCYIIDHESRQKAEMAYRKLGRKLYNSLKTTRPISRIKMSTIIKIWGGRPELRSN